MADARKRRFDAVCVWKLDRWGRSVADSIKSILELGSLGVRFVAVTQNIDTDESSPMARLQLQIMAAFAELEREIIRERVVAGVKAVIRHYSVLCVVKAITCRISRLPRPLQDVTRCYEDRYVTHDYTLRSGMKAQS